MLSQVQPCRFCPRLCQLHTAGCGPEELRAWKEIVLEVSERISSGEKMLRPMQKLEKDKTLSKIEQSIPQHPYSVCQSLPLV
jgi:preprotein translocase subunit SecA